MDERISEKFDTDIADGTARERRVAHALYNNFFWHVFPKSSLEDNGVDNGGERIPDEKEVAPDRFREPDYKLIIPDKKDLFIEIKAGPSRSVTLKDTDFNILERRVGKKNLWYVLSANVDVEVQYKTHYIMSPDETFEIFRKRKSKYHEGYGSKKGRRFFRDELDEFMPKHQVFSLDGGKLRVAESILMEISHYGN